MATEIEQFIAGLSDADPAARCRAAEALCRLATESTAALVPLVRATGDSSDEVCDWATSALEESGPPAAGDVSNLAELLADANSDVGYWSATLLGRLQAEAAPAVPALKAALSDSAAMNVRQRAAWALGKIGPLAAVALKDLETAKSSDDARLARLAERAIDDIGG